MASLLRTTTLAIAFPIVLLTLDASAMAAPQDQGTAPPASFQRVQDTLNRTPSQSLKFDAKVPVPTATFRVTVTEHAFVVPIMESLRKEFELTPLQRQSAAWSSQCCGLNLATLTESIERSFRRWEERRIRDRVSRELAEVEAAARKQSPQDRWPGCRARFRIPDPGPRTTDPGSRTTRTDPGPRTRQIPETAAKLRRALN